MATPRPTMADVARQAGVSVPTVSKVLNGRGDVSEATRSKVQRAMGSTGYSGRVGRRESTGIIDVVIDGVGDPWAAQILGGAERSAAEAGRTLAVTASRRPGFSFDHWIAMIAKRRSDGIVFVLSRAGHEELATLAELSLPVVLLDPVGEDEPGLATVGATNWSGGLAATEHLLALGHRRIGFIGGPAELQCSQHRLDGYAAALRRAGVEFAGELIRYGDFRPDGGREQAEVLFGLAEPPSAIFAGSDSQAAGVYQVAAQRGLRVPDDVSVVGFDDTSICTVLSPPLTTIRQPLAEMAGEAVRLVLRQAKSGPVDADPAPRIELATSLVVRDSTRAVAADRNRSVDLR
jgi:LacI family xylobiose transport system transcriptional regulator